MAPGSVAPIVPMFKSLAWLNRDTAPRGQQDSNPGPLLEADALPTGQPGGSKPVSCTDVPLWTVEWHVLNTSPRGIQGTVRYWQKLWTLY